MQQKDQVFPGEIAYNSGVVVFRKDSPILSAWAKISIEQNHHFMGDQNALSRAIFHTSPPMEELPPIYNWKKNDPPNQNAVILHYVASSKVEIIQSLMTSRV